MPLVRRVADKDSYALQTEPPKLPTDYASLRAEVAGVAAKLRSGHAAALGLTVRNSYKIAFGIVGEEVAETPLRRRLRNFYLGPVFEASDAPGGLSGNNPTTRAFVLSPSREIVQKNAVFMEPMATYLARQALKHNWSDLTDRLEVNAEDNAGALFRSMTDGSRRNFSADEADLAVVSLLPLVAPDVRLTLQAGYNEYAQR